MSYKGVKMNSDSIKCKVKVFARDSEDPVACTAVAMQ
jgi:hypothetical protein